VASGRVLYCAVAQVLLYSRRAPLSLQYCTVLLLYYTPVTITLALQKQKLRADMASHKRHKALCYCYFTSRHSFQTQAGAGGLTMSASGYPLALGQGQKALYIVPCKILVSIKYFTAWEMLYLVVSPKTRGVCVGGVTKTKTMQIHYI
jgi:hypothetical protein